MKKILALILASAMVLSALCGCAAKASAGAPATTQETVAETTAKAAAPETKAPETTAAETKAAEASSTKSGEKEEITIVYTNDVHSYIYNVNTNKETKETTPGLRPSTAAAMKKDLIAQGKNVLLVDAGDEIQGNIYGSVNKGETIIDILNLADYDLACPGNHEYDYGMANFFDRIAQAKYPFISCTFKNVSDNSTVLESSKIFDFNGTKVAFVGVTTPLTPSTLARTTFMNEKKEPIYTFSGEKDPQEFYSDVQAAVDAVRDKADYVIALGHVGVEAVAQALKVSSKDLIANVEGFDAFIDGHSHTTMECEMIKDKTGKEIPLTQTGCYLTSIGMMTISPIGEITTKLVKQYDNKDADTAALENDFEAVIKEYTSTKIGELEETLCTHDPENPDQRLVRMQETNLGDFITDAYYWYLNTVVGTECDVVINNGGGLRAPVQKGDITYLDIKNVVPFSNTICMIKVTGAELKDILENGVAAVGLWDPQENTPAENGSFIHAAGIKFTVDASIPTSIEYDGDNFKKVNGEYRVRDLQIYNKSTGAYEDVDPNRTYNLGGIDYMLRNGGSGLAFLGDNECVISYVGPEVELVIEYVHSFTKNGEYSIVKTANSPLTKYNNYLMDYENPYGSGRINIINIDYKK